MDSSELGNRVRERRRALGVTQIELSALAGCSPAFLRNLEQGKRSVRLDKLNDVLEVLGLTLTVVDTEKSEGNDAAREDS